MSGEQFEQQLLTHVPFEYLVYTLIVILAVIIVIVKLIPTVGGWFNAARTNVNNYENLSTQVHKNTREIELINQKMSRDYAKLNFIDGVINKQQEYIKDSLEERELLLKSMLAVIQGLQELGTNGPTKEAESAIQDYLLHKSHNVDLEKTKS